MRYEQKKSVDSEYFYEVKEQGERVAEFSYRIDAGESLRQQHTFRIGFIRFEQNYRTYERLDLVLQFIQYKCWCSGCTAMYLRLNSRNLLELERLKRFGFYVMAEESAKDSGSCDYVLKYPLPREWEEIQSVREKRSKNMIK